MKVIMMMIAWMERKKVLSIFGAEPNLVVKGINPIQVIASVARSNTNDIPNLNSSKIRPTIAGIGMTFELLRRTY